MKPNTNTYPISAEMLSTLHKEVTSLSSVILSNPLLPILENFLVKIVDKELVLAASDQQTSIVSKLPFEGNIPASPLEIAVPARMFKETLKSLPKQPISLSVDRERYNLAIETLNGRYRIACENPNDFPNLFAFSQAETEIILTSDLLQEAIKKTIFAVSKDELRPEISGVFLSLNSEGITFVATDGHKLVSYQREDVKHNKAVTCIIPAKSLQLINQLLTGQPGKEIKLTFQEKRLQISWDHIQIIIALINETYPDYENVIPRNNPHRLIVNTNCITTLKRLSIYTNKATQQIRFQVSKNSIKITAEDIHFANEAHETIACQYQGPDMEIGFNAKLLIEILNVLPAGEEVAMALDMPNKAVPITPTTPKSNENLRMLIMPILLNK